MFFFLSFGYYYCRWHITLLFWNVLLAARRRQSLQRLWPNQQLNRCIEEKRKTLFHANEDWERKSLFSYRRKVIFIYGLSSQRLHIIWPFQFEYTFVEVFLSFCPFPCACACWSNVNRINMCNEFRVFGVTYMFIQIRIRPTCNMCFHVCRFDCKLSNPAKCNAADEKSDPILIENERYCRNIT